jgi:hypothetical protein
MMRINAGSGEIAALSQWTGRNWVPGRVSALRHAAQPPLQGAAIPPRCPARQAKVLEMVFDVGMAFLELKRSSSSSTSTITLPVPRFR